MKQRELLEDFITRYRGGSRITFSNHPLLLPFAKTAEIHCLGEVRFCGDDHSNVSPIAILQIAFEYAGRVYTCELTAPPEKIQDYSDYFEKFCGSLRPNVWGYGESCDATRSESPCPRDADIGRIGSSVLLQFGAACPRSRH